MYCSDIIIRENIFNVKINVCEKLDIIRVKRYIKS